MSVQGLAPLELSIFGSLVTYTDPTVLPQGVSPDNQDVQFTLDGVKTRDGLLTTITPTAATKVNGVKTHITPQFTLRTLALDSGGTLSREVVPIGSGIGAVSSVKAGLSLNAFMEAVTQFGREYLAFGDGTAGIELPYQYVDQAAAAPQFDRISQVGPGASPTAADATLTTVAIAAPATGAVRNAAGTQVTILTSAPHGLIITAANIASNQTVTIAGVTDTTFNGTFPVLSVADTTHFIYAQTGTPAATSGNGTMAISGNITVGIHGVSVLFVTRQLYFTRPAPPTFWTAAGNHQVTLSNIPTGPSNVIARILCFTGAAGATYYYVDSLTPALFQGNMRIADNTTTTITIDFSDAILLSGTPAAKLFNNIELGECAGNKAYASRLFWWGERNKIQQFLNLTFDGGFSTNTPLGWVLDGVNGAGGSKESTLVVWGDAYKITGDGATAIRGLITQAAVTDWLGTALISPNVDYSVRARIRSGGSLIAGTLHVHLFGTGVNTTGITVTAAQATGSYVEFIAQLTAPLTTIPSDLTIRVYADGTPTNNGFFLVDNIEIYPTLTPTRTFSVRASRVENPESYDGVTGFLNVSEGDDTLVRSAFVLRNILYFVKDHSFHSTQDSGTTEPSLWSIDDTSRKIGTESVHGTDVGDDFAAIADRDGLYMFDGGTPTKLSEEIQPTWDRINWQYGTTLWVKVDPRAKRIYVGVPLDTAIQTNAILVLDYKDGFAPPLHITLTGRLVAAAKARRWTIWNISANSANLIERGDGTNKLWVGSNGTTGAVQQLTAGQLSDDGVAINGYYITAFLTGSEIGQVLPVGRQLTGYFTTSVEGAGSLSITAFLNTFKKQRVLRPTGFTLSSPPYHDLEVSSDVKAERVAYKFGTNAVGAWFSLKKITAWIKPAPMTFVRGGV